MNRRIRKKLNKRSGLRHYRDFEMLLRVFIKVAYYTDGLVVRDFDGRHVIVDSERAARIWRQLLYDFKHTKKMPYLSFQHLRFARHLETTDKHDNPSLPPIVLTERHDSGPFAPVTKGESE